MKSGNEANLAEAARLLKETQDAQAAYWKAQDSLEAQLLKTFGGASLAVYLEDLEGVSIEDIQEICGWWDAQPAGDKVDCNCGMFIQDDQQDHHRDCPNGKVRA